MAKQPVARQIAKSISPVVGASTIANLDGRTTPEAAKAPAQAGLRAGRHITGQYLYDQFIADNKADTSRMDVVRRAVENTDVASFKKAVGDMVAVAAGIRDKAIEAAKEAGTYDEDTPTGDVSIALGRYKTAQNTQTGVRNAYGALKFASDALVRFGYTETTGWLLMQVLARKALADAAVKWDGSPVVPTEQKAVINQSKAEAKALAAVMIDQPRNPDEKLADYLGRVGDAVDAKVVQQRADSERKLIDDLVTKVRTMAGGLLDDVLAKLLEGEPETTLDPEEAKAAAPKATKH